MLSILGHLIRLAGRRTALAQWDQSALGDRGRAAAEDLGDWLH